MVQELGEERIQWREVNILKDLDYAVQMGVLSTPAIAVDGEIVFVGLPSSKKLQALLEEKLNPVN
jgi:protein-disulfide isomerase